MNRVFWYSTGLRVGMKPNRLQQWGKGHHLHMHTTQGPECKGCCLYCILMPNQLHLITIRNDHPICSIKLSWFTHCPISWLVHSFTVLICNSQTMPLFAKHTNQYSIKPKGGAWRFIWIRPNSRHGLANLYHLHCCFYNAALHSCIAWNNIIAVAQLKKKNILFVISEVRTIYYWDLCLQSNFNWAANQQLINIPIDDALEHKGSSLTHLTT